MARVVSVLNMSHGPFTSLHADKWETIRQARLPYRADVPVETAEERVEKARRSRAGLEVLHEKLLESKPDVLVIFGDDQFENFNFSNYPSLSVYVGETFAGATKESGRDKTKFATVRNHRPLAVHILTKLIENKFDPAFSVTLPNEESGMCHAIMRPLEFFNLYDLPVVPLNANGYFPPQLPAVRCYEIGKAARLAIDSFPEDLRVCVIGSGGLWHTPGREGAYLDEEFDQQCLNFIAKGDPLGAAEYFDSYVVPAGDISQAILPDVAGMTGLPSISGPMMGTREFCNWVAASAVIDGEPNNVVDYIPVYSSPIGTSFSWWTAE